MKTILETLDTGCAWLEARGVEDARRNMQLMLGKVLGCSKIELYTRFDEALDESVLAPLREMLKQRGERVPLQHLLGEVEFFKRRFSTDARALIPRPETEELVEIVLDRLQQSDFLASRQHGIQLADIGCGSGVIGLSLAAEWRVLRAKQPHTPPLSVHCIDKSEDALSLARENAQRIGENEVTFSQGDLLSKCDKHFDAVIANLPYVPQEHKAVAPRELHHDPEMALYAEQGGLQLIAALIEMVNSYTTSGAFIALEIGIDQSDAVEKMMQNAHLQRVQTMVDLSGIPRFPLAYTSL